MPRKKQIDPVSHLEKELVLSYEICQLVQLSVPNEQIFSEILEHIGVIGEFDEKPGTGLAVQIDVEDAVGALSQAERLVDIVEEQL